MEAEDPRQLALAAAVELRAFQRRLEAILDRLPPGRERVRLEWICRRELGWVVETFEAFARRGP